MTRTLSKLTKRLKKRNEHGNMLIVVLLMLPVLMGIFGIAVDVSIATYSRSSVQHALDIATTTAAGQATTGSTQQAFNIDATKRVALEVYEENRQGGSSFLCPKPGSPSTCYTVKYTFYDSKGNITQGNNAVRFTMTVNERSKNLFLSSVGYPTQKLTVKSEARLTYALE